MAFHSAPLPLSFGVDHSTPLQDWSAPLLLPLPGVSTIGVMAEDLAGEFDLVIEPQPGWRLVDLRDLWRYRELLIILAMRDIQVRYRQTIVGAAWAVLQPVTLMAVFTCLFTLVGRFPTTGDMPYAVSLYCALLPWQLFANALAQSGESLVANQQLITKVYFPRVLVPVAPIVSGLVDFAIAMVVLAGMMAYYHEPSAGIDLSPGLSVLALPLFVLLAVISSLSLGLWLSALNAMYRDIRYVLPLAIQLGMIASPVLYDLTFLGERLAARDMSPMWLHVYALNPMVAVIEGFRWSLLGGAFPPIGPMAVSVAMVMVLLVTGLMYFRRMERFFADRV